VVEVEGDAERGRGEDGERGKRITNEQ